MVYTPGEISLKQQTRIEGWLYSSEPEPHYREESIFEGILVVDYPVGEDIGWPSKIRSLLKSKGWTNHKIGRFFQYFRQTSLEPEEGFERGD